MYIHIKRFGKKRLACLLVRMTRLVENTKKEPHSFKNSYALLISNHPYKFLFISK